MTFINISHLLNLISYKVTWSLQIFNIGEIADRVGAKRFAPPTMGALPQKHY